MWTASGPACWPSGCWAADYTGARLQFVARRRNSRDSCRTAVTAFNRMSLLRRDNLTFVKRTKIKCTYIQNHLFFRSLLFGESLGPDHVHANVGSRVGSVLLVQGSRMSETKRFQLKKSRVLKLKWATIYLLLFCAVNCWYPKLAGKCNMPACVSGFCANRAA